VTCAPATVQTIRAALNDEVLPRHLEFLESLMMKSKTGWIAGTKVRRRASARQVFSLAFHSALACVPLLCPVTRHVSRPPSLRLRHESARFYSSFDIAKKEPSIADFVLVPRLQWLASGVNEGISKNILHPYPLLRSLITTLMIQPQARAHTCTCTVLKIYLPYIAFSLPRRALSLTDCGVLRGAQDAAAQGDKGRRRAQLASESHADVSASPRRKRLLFFAATSRRDCPYTQRLPPTNFVAPHRT
jgi:hypothetical protein